MLDLDAIIRHWEMNSSKDYFFLSLFGLIKGEKHDHTHIIPCVNVTSIKISIRKLIARVIKQKGQLRFIDGPLLSDRNGEVVSAKFIDDLLCSCLTDIHEADKSMFPVDIQKKIGNNLAETELVLKGY